MEPDFLRESFKRLGYRFSYYYSGIKCHKNSIFAAIQYLTFNTRTNDIIRIAVLFVITFFILRLISAAIQYSIFTFLGKQENSETKQKQARGLIIILKAVVWILGIGYTPGGVRFSQRDGMNRTASATLVLMDERG